MHLYSYVPHDSPDDGLSRPKHIVSGIIKTIVRLTVAPTFLFVSSTKSHVTCVPCHYGTARPQVTDGGDGLQIWRVAANILNKQSWTVDTEWSCSLGAGRGASNSSP
jgi:hypothetical protein